MVESSNDSLRPLPRDDVQFILKHGIWTEKNMTKVSGLRAGLCLKSNFLFRASYSSFLKSENKQISMKMCFNLSFSFLFKQRIILSILWYFRRSFACLNYCYPINYLYKSTRTSNLLSNWFSLIIIVTDSLGLLNQTTRNILSII